MTKYPPDKEPNRQKTPRRATRTASSYAKYSGMAVQMIVILLAGYYLGEWVMDYFGFESQLLQALFILVAVGLALYLPLKSVLAEEK